jgi:hypothetical protein
MTSEQRPKTYKREVASAIALFWAGLIIWGHIDPSTGAAETGQAITIPVFMLVAGAFGIDAIFKQGQAEFTVSQAPRSNL